MQPIKTVRLFRVLRARGIQRLARLRGDLLRVVCNEILLHPRGPRSLHLQVKQTLPRVLDKFLRLRCRYGSFLPWLCFGRRLSCRRSLSKNQNCNCANKMNQPLHSSSSHAPAFCVLATTSCSRTIALSIPARSTSQCVTNRTECSAVSCAHTPKG